MFHIVLGIILVVLGYCIYQSGDIQQMSDEERKEHGLGPKYGFTQKGLDNEKN